MSYYDWQKNQGKTPEEILHEMHKKHFQIHMDQRKDEEQKSWIAKEIQRQLPKAIAKELKKIK